jgi:glutathione reductase (NADPH)
MIHSPRVLDLETLPRHILFVGGGFIAFEVAHFAVRLGEPGTRCTILEAKSRPLGPFDAEMVGLLSEASAAEGIDIHCNSTITSIKKEKGIFTVTTEEGHRVEADLVVNGAGRVPAIGDLELAKGGIEYTKKGITVDKNMTTSNPDVFALGDCAATVMLARVADAEAKTAVDTVLNRLNKNHRVSAMDYTAIPSLLFTYPQYGMVGVTEKTLEEKGISYEKSFGKELSWPTYRRVGLRSAAYKILVGEAETILGAHILSDNAAGLINAIALAMANRISVEDLYRQSILTPYPSRESDLIYMLNSFIR